MQMHNFVATGEVIINSKFPVDRMRELNFHRETAVDLLIKSPYERALLMLFPWSS